MTKTMTRDELQRQVREIASHDRTFRQALLENPEKAIHDRLGINLPPGTELLVVEETPTRVCFVLPPWSDDLTESDLAKVAGGARISKAQLIKLQ